MQKGECIFMEETRFDASAAPVPPLFSIHDADVVRAGKTILHVDDFSLAEGEHVALLGPNGAGKSLDHARGGARASAC